MMYGLQGRNPPCRQAHGSCRYFRMRSVACRGAIRHADRLTASPFAVAAFAVCIRKYLHLPVSRPTAAVAIFGCAWLIACAHNKEEHSSAVFSNGLTATNALPQLTPSNGLFLLFVWLSALFPLHLCTDCTVMSGQILLHSLMLSPDLHSLS